MILLVNLRQVFGMQIVITGSDGSAISFEKNRRLSFNTKYLLEDHKNMLGDTRQEDIKFKNNKYLIILKDFIRHPVLFAMRPLRTWSIKIEHISQKQLPITVSVENKLNPKVWVGRQPVLNGVLPSDLDVSLELDYLRGINTLDILVRAAYLENVNYDFFCSHLFKMQEIEFGNSPLISQVEISNAKILSGRIVLEQDSIFPVSNYRNEVSVHKAGYLQKDDVFDGFFVINTFSERNRIEEALYIGASSSWFHFLIECVPRLIAIPKEKRVKLPVVVPAGLPSQIVTVCEKLTDAKVIPVRLMESVKIDKLLVGIERSVTDPLEFEFRKNYIQIAIAEIRKLSVKSVNDSKGFDKVYLLRPNGLFRPLQNQRQILRFLRRIGFEIISPETMSLDDVVKVMSSARVIVAESGAAITNVLFARPGAILIEIYPGKGPLTFWPELASISGVKVEKLMSKRLVIGPRGIARDGIYVSKRKLNKLIHKSLQ
jgi:hypothetical protein